MSFWGVKDISNVWKCWNKVLFWWLWVQQKQRNHYPCRQTARSPVRKQCPCVCEVPAGEVRCSQLSADRSNKPTAIWSEQAWRNKHVGFCQFFKEPEIKDSRNAAPKPTLQSDVHTIAQTIQYCGGSRTQQQENDWNAVFTHGTAWGSCVSNITET